MFTVKAGGPVKFFNKFIFRMHIHMQKRDCLLCVCEHRGRMLTVKQVDILIAKNQALHILYLKGGV